MYFKSFCTAAAVGLLLTSTVMAQDDFSTAGLRAKALKALNDGDNRTAIENADAMVRQDPDSARTTRQAADIYLRAGKVKWATRLFDRYLETEKQDLPELWQRGIALYFTGDFKTAVKQFEVHRTVNPNDVENAAWHFLCVAKLESPSEAKGKLLAAPGDPRPPMEEVLKMLKTGDRQAITARIEQLPEDSKEREIADFYGDFYLGLYADALGEKTKAQSLMNRAARKAPRNYMGDVARVYARYLSGKL